MAKRRKKKATQSKPRVRSRPRSGAKGKPYFFDRLLASVTLLSLGCLSTILTFLGLSYGNHTATEIRRAVIQQNAAFKHSEILTDRGLMLLGGAVVVFAVFQLLTAIGLWRSRRWALWAELLLSIGSLGTSFGAKDGASGSCWTLLVTIYCILRLTGTVGPRLT